jgi:hypothetical protein
MVDCLLCTEQIAYAAVGPCRHAICSLCALRMRYKLSDMSCPVCKLHCENVVVMPVSNAGSHDPLQIAVVGALQILATKDYDGARFQRDYVSNIVFADCMEHFDMLMSYVMMNCKLCDERCDCLEDLDDHLKMVHQQCICLLCARNRSLFAYELDLFTSDELLCHASVNFDLMSRSGHPECEFCGQRYFDSDALHQHFKECHYTCSLCTLFPHRYYSDLESLRKHMRCLHFLCEMCDGQSLQVLDIILQ